MDRVACHHHILQYRLALGLHDGLGGCSIAIALTPSSDWPLLKKLYSMVLNKIVFEFPAQHALAEREHAVIFGEFEVRPDSVTVSSLFSGCGGDVKVGGLVHCWGVKIGVEECDCDDDIEFLVEY
ncbi:hypothetical protein Tco_0731603 [Tanacetum coccineum]